MPFLVFAPCLGLNRAASSLSKGSLEEVDEQRLAASPDTDKSRFLTFCYALETFLDAPANLMQAPIFNVLRDRKKPAAELHLLLSWMCAMRSRETMI